MFKNIVFGVGIFAALLAMLIFSGRLPIGKANTPVATGDVFVWGTLPQAQMENLFQSINNTTKTYRLNYVEVREDVFSSRLLEALASGGAPDAIIAPYQIILEHRSRIFPYPIEDFPSAGIKGLKEQEYRDLYVDGASIFYTESGALALPLSISPLVLFYNRTLLSNAGIINPPALWEDITAMVPKLGSVDVSGRILQSAISMGAYGNVPAAKDIIMTLVAQIGQVPVRRVLSGGVEQFGVLANAPLSTEDTVRPLTSAARFFTQFSDPTKSTYTWSPLMPQAQDQFLAEKSAMYVGYSDEEALMHLKNPRIDFGVKFLPQVKVSKDRNVTGMKLYGIATLKRSTNINTSIIAQALLAGVGDLKVQYGPVIASIAAGITPIKYLIDQTPNLNPEYKKAVLVARGWYDINQTTSNQLMQSMVNDILSGRKNISEASDAFVTGLSESYTR